MISKNIIRQYIENKWSDAWRALWIESCANLEAALIALRQMPKDHADFMRLHRTIRYKVRRIKWKKLKFESTGSVWKYFTYFKSNEFFDSEKEDLFEKYTKIFEEEIFKVTGKTKGNS
jgi:hypothetical protein